MVLQFKDANDALNDVLLRGQFEARPIYLSLGEGARQQFASALGLDADDVQEQACLAVGRSLKASGDPYAPHTAAMVRWRAFHHDDAPPFTAVLFALSYAASLMAPDENVGGGNYYKRLSEALGFPNQQALSFNGRSTEPLWKAFNAWLVKHDYEYGRPTARPFNANRYINYPQTQAVVRAGDRHLFHHMFERYGFTGAEFLGPGDIRPYLDDWMAGSRANGRLKAAWRKPELKERFCEVVIAELEDWSSGEGVGPQASGPKRLRLALAATLANRMPRPRIGLHAGALDPATGDARLVLQDGRVAVLGNHVFGRLKTLSPGPSADGGFRGISARSADGRLVAEWSPRLVIPMERSQDGPYWVETSRVRLGGEYLVLVRDKSRVTDAVDAYLAAASSLQSRVARPGALDGLPDGWVAYTGVMVIKPGVVPSSEDVQPLVPLAKELSDLSFTGGLRLAPGIWHAHSPPSIVFMTMAQAARVTASGIGPDGDPVLVAEASGARGASILEERLRGLGEGEYEAAAHAGDRLVASKSFVLRSASNPRALARQGQQLSYWCVGSASKDGPPAGWDTPFAAPDLPQAGDAPPSLGNDIPGDPGLQAGLPADGCISRAAHHWCGPYYGPGTTPPSLVPVECKDCGQESFVGKPGKGAQAPAKSTLKPGEWQPASQALDPVDHDLVLDALCFLGSGTLARLEGILAGLVDDPVSASRLAQDYSGLGFLDLEVERGSGRLKSWSVPPQAAIFMSASEAVVSGFRSRETCQALREAVESAGGQASFLPCDGRPARLSVSGIPAGAFTELAAALPDPLGREFQVLEGGARDILQRCEGLAPPSALLAPLSLSWNDVQARYDLGAMKWVEWGGVRGPGAYRVQWAGTTYAWVARDGRIASGPAPVVTLAAAREAGKRLHDYDPAGQRFSCALAARPLGLHGRALAACSGGLPRVANGQLHYQGVPAGIAAAVMEALYE